MTSEQAKNTVEATISRVPRSWDWTAPAWIPAPVDGEDAVAEAMELVMMNVTKEKRPLAGAADLEGNRLT